MKKALMNYVKLIIKGILDGNKIKLWYWQKNMYL